MTGHGKNLHQLYLEQLEIEDEIRRICSAGVQGHYVDSKRAEQLSRKYPDIYERIHTEEKKKAEDELNPLSGASV